MKETVSIFDLYAISERESRIKRRDDDRKRILSKYPNAVEDRESRIVDGREISELELLFRNDWNCSGRTK